MAVFQILVRVVEIFPGEYHVMVSAVSPDVEEVEVRHDMVPTSAAAIERRDFIVMSLATELRARGHEVAGVVE